MLPAQLLATRSLALARLRQRDGSRVTETAERHRVVVVGAGFGGLFAARRLGHMPVDVTLIDRRNHHLFQPLLYQVATGMLSPGQIAPPIRHVVRKHKNVRVELAEVTGFDLDRRIVHATTVAGIHTLEIPYDTPDRRRPGPISRTSATTSSPGTRPA